MVESLKLKSEIDTVVRATIRSGDVVNVLVDRDENFNGDPRLNVKVIYNSKNKKLNVDETIGLKAVVRKRLQDIGEDAFPVFYFILKSEAGNLAAAG